MNNTLLLIGNRWNKNMGDELILVGMLKYFLDWHPNRQSVQVSKWTFREKDLEKYFYWKKPFRQFNKVIVPTSDKEFLENFLNQFFDENFIKEKIILVWELPHGIRSLLKWILKWRFFDIFYYFKVDAVSIWWWEIFTEECWSWPLFFTITALPFLIKYFLFKIFRKKLYIYLFGWIQFPFRWFNKILVKFWILNADGIYLRDFESFEVVSRILYFNTKNYRIHWYFQQIKKIYFMFDHSYLLFSNKEDWKILKYNSINEKDILLVNINPIGYRKFQKKVWNLLYKKNFGILYYIPVNLLEDDKFYFLLKDKFKNVKIKKILRHNDFRFFLERIKDVKEWIVMRLHMFLLLAYLNKKIVVFRYQRKIMKIYYVIKILKNLTKMNPIIILK